MQLFIRSLVVLSLLSGFSLPALSADDTGLSVDSCNKLEIYSKKGCPHCAKAYLFLDELKEQYSQLEIIAHDINENDLVLEQFIRLNEQHEIERPGVPLIQVCEQVMVGFDNAQTSGATIKQWLGLLNTGEHSGADDQITAPWIGTVKVSSLGLPVFTILIGLVDGFNPCAMWVLLMLLSLLVHLQDRRRILLVAGIFVLVSGLVYFAFMAAWLNMFLIIGYSRLLQLFLGIIAILIGAIHMKDYLAFGRGVSLSIPDSAKQPIYTRIRRVLNAEDLFGALCGVVILAVLVNLVELLCTAGLPALYTQILANRGLQWFEYYAYLLLYNIAYMFDDGIMVGIAVYTLGSSKLQESSGRWLKLLSGAVIFLLGLLMLFSPQLLF
jgi:glutaredoxin